MIGYIELQLGCHPVAVVQYTFTHKQYIEKHSSLIWKSVDRARLCEVYSDICLTTEEKAWKTLNK
jgi:hypothetical protein